MTSIPDRARNDVAAPAGSTLPSLNHQDGTTTWFATSEEWKRGLGLVRFCAWVAQVAGPLSATRAIAWHLQGSAGQVEQALCVLASLQAKGVLRVNIRGIRQELGSINADLGSLRVHIPKARRRCAGSVSLPVEKARAVDILTLLDRYGIAARRVGHGYQARCPLHDDRRPSLSIDPQRGLWYCFACGIGGDGIALVMRLKGLPFAEAVLQVAT